MRVTAVVEPVNPPELFEFFIEFRKALGMDVVPLGPAAGSAVLKAIKENHVTVLLADRDILGNGIEVDFFGERTTLPPGPVTVALRTGAPLIPAGVYFRGDGHHAVVRPPMDLSRRGRFREDVERITQDMAGELESLIRLAPEQWHLQQPNWPSDYDALGRHRQAPRASGEPEPVARSVTQGLRSGYRSRGRGWAGDVGGGVSPRRSRWTWCGCRRRGSARPISLPQPLRLKPPNGLAKSYWP